MQSLLDEYTSFVIDEGLKDKFEPTWPSSGRIPAWVSEEEKQFLCYCALHKDFPEGDILEIGSGWAGMSFYLASYNNIRNEVVGEDNSVLTVDPLLSLPGELDCTIAARMLNIVFRYGRLANTQFLMGTSNDLARWMNLHTFRMIFIDGNHTVPWIKDDLINCSRFVMNNGIIILHDLYIYDFNSELLDVKEWADNELLSGNFDSQLSGSFYKARIPGTTMVAMIKTMEE
jgi:hypothetical protein